MTTLDTSRRATFGADQPPFHVELPGALLPFAWLTPHGWSVFIRAARRFRDVQTWRDVAAAVIALLGSGPWRDEAPTQEQVERILEWRGLDLDAPVSLTSDAEVES